MSLHLVKSGRSRIVAAADYAGCHQSGPPRTDIPKLFAIGRHTICGVVGMMNTGPRKTIESRIQTISASPELKDSPAQFLVALRNDLAPRLVARVAQNPKRFRWLLPDTAMLLGIFALRRLPGGVVDLLELQFPLEEVEGAPALGAPRIIEHIAGAIPSGPALFFLSPGAADTDRLTEATRDINPDATDESVLLDIDGAIERLRADSAWRAETTAEMDVVAIEEGGVRWLRRPQREGAVLRKRPSGILIPAFMCVALALSVLFAHFGKGHARWEWSSELVVHHGGIPLANALLGVILAAVVIAAFHWLWRTLRPGLWRFLLRIGAVRCWLTNI